MPVDYIIPFVDSSDREWVGEYWNPNLQLYSKGHARVTLYNNSRTTQIQVEAAGQAADGTLLWNR